MTHIQTQSTIGLIQVERKLCKVNCLIWHSMLNLFKTWQTNANIRKSKREETTMFFIRWKFNWFLNKVGLYETMTIENVHRVFMKLVIRPEDHSDYGGYKCIANNTLGETEKVIHLHRKLTFDLKHSTCW